MNLADWRFQVPQQDGIHALFSVICVYRKSAQLDQRIALDAPRCLIKGTVGKYGFRLFAQATTMPSHLILHLGRAGH